MAELFFLSAVMSSLARVSSHHFV